jgi:outer membrane protein OmpA-like peptidoglycan-associated protein
MAEDWAVDVRKYAPDADDTIIAAIVRHCGIALRNRDSSQVSFTDSTETALVRDGYCRKKLGLTDPDTVIDAAIARVGERMAGDSTRNRVTVYYLLAEAFGKLELFGAVAAVEEPEPEREPPLLIAASSAAGVFGASRMADAPVLKAAPVAAKLAPVDRRGPEGGVMFATLGGLAAVIIGAAGIASMFDHRAGRDGGVPAAPAILTPMAPAAPEAAPAAAAPVIPTGSGVTAQDVAGKPTVSVYFDTGKTAVSPDFAAAAAPVKAWIDSHPGARLAVSGFNDPSGNAAFNAELSKNRAKSVAAALAAIGVSADVIDLEKPAATTDTGTTPAQARRVDIMVKDAT